MPMGQLDMKTNKDAMGNWGRNPVAFVRDGHSEEDPCHL